MRSRISGPCPMAGESDGQPRFLPPGKRVSTYNPSVEPTPSNDLHRTRATQLLHDWNAGDPQAQERLLPIVYEELRRLASGYFGGGAAQVTLQPTVLVHEAFLRLVGKPTDFRDRRHFYAVAATAMRQIAVDAARSRRALKRGGADANRVTISGIGSDESDPTDALTLHEALESLAAEHERAARVAELRLFGGLTLEEVADAIGMSERTVRFDWRYARACLRKALHGEST